jgi:hypothetical protein
MHGGHGGLGRSHRGQSCSYRGMWVPARDWSAVRPSSRAGSLLQGNGCTCRRLVGCQAVFAGKPRSYSGMGVPVKEIGRVSGRLREQARSYSGMGVPAKRLVGCQAAFAGKPRSYSGMGVPARDWSAVRPPSRAGSLLQWNVGTCKKDWSAGRPPSRASLAPTRGSV